MHLCNHDAGRRLVGSAGARSCGRAVGLGAMAWTWIRCGLDNSIETWWLWLCQCTIDQSSRAAGGNDAWACRVSPCHKADDRLGLRLDG